MRRNVEQKGSFNLKEDRRELREAVERVKNLILWKGDGEKQVILKTCSLPECLMYGIYHRELIWLAAVTLNIFGSVSEIVLWSSQIDFWILKQNKNSKFSFMYNLYHISNIYNSWIKVIFKTLAYHHVLRAHVHS